MASVYIEFFAEHVSMSWVLGCFLDKRDAKVLTSESEGLQVQQSTSHFIGDIPDRVTQNDVDANFLNPLNLVSHQCSNAAVPDGNTILQDRPDLLAVIVGEDAGVKLEDLHSSEVPDLFVSPCNHVLYMGIELQIF